jgi:hypothetical protein
MDSTLTRRKEASSLILEDLPLAAELAEPARLLCLAIVCSFVLVFFGISLSPHAALHDLINVSRILWKEGTVTTKSDDRPWDLPQP